MSKSISGEIQQKLKDAQRILIVSHIRPDGDAIGSLLGFGLALQAVGKDVQMVLADGVPASFRHLEGAKQVRTSPVGAFDFTVVVDCSDLIRVGKAFEGVLEAGPEGNIIPDLNIDHHITNLNFARLNLVETTAVATAEILANRFMEWGLPVTRSIAEALLTGLVTDTLGFRTSNMTPDALRTAARLMEAGAELPDLYYQALVSRSYEAACFWGHGLIRLQRDGPMVWTVLTMEDRRKANYPGADDADLINILSTIEGAAVSLIFVEQPRGKVKISWRAQPGLDVSQIALVFGGGGHQAAAGAEVEGAVDEVQEVVLRATRTLFQKTV